MRFTSPKTWRKIQSMADANERKTAMSNPMEKLFEELAEKVLEQTMCDNCLADFPDDEMNYDPKVRDGAPVCKECYEILTN